jgi:hypothetical protein
MEKRQIAPCLECGGEPQEIEEWAKREHTYSKVGLFDEEIFCDFCDADMPSTDPLVWGFPKGFNWDKELGSHSYEMLKVSPPLREEAVCPNCHNTYRRQEFIIRNAKRNGVALPHKYWPYLTE